MSLFVAGVDVGSLCTKVVVLNENKEIVASTIIRSGSAFKGSAEAAMAEALNNSGLGSAKVSFIIGTGYGRARIPFANDQVTEISCHARGAWFLCPGTRSVIDIGGQDSKAIKVGPQGQALHFVMNDKCAAGTGRFLEVMANALEVDMDEMSRIAMEAVTNAEVSSTCTVFAESEVISLFAQGVPRKEIAAAIYRSIARRIAGLAGRLGLEKPVTMTGGVAKNKGMVWALEERLGIKLLVPPEPQIMGALGAALIAYDRHARQTAG